MPSRGLTLSLMMILFSSRRILVILIACRILRGRIYLSHLSTNVELGKSVIEALSASRTIDPKLSPEFFDFRGRVAVQYEAWVADLMSRFGYKTRRALFKNMKSCSVDAVGEVITMRPSHHEKLEAWTGKGIAEKDYVVVTSCCTHQRKRGQIYFPYSKFGSWGVHLSKRHHLVYPGDPRSGYGDPEP